MEELTTETEVKLIFSSSSFKVAIGHIEYCPLVAALTNKQKIYIYINKNWFNDHRSWSWLGQSPSIHPFSEHQKAENTFPQLLHRRPHAYAAGDGATVGMYFLHQIYTLWLHDLMTLIRWMSAVVEGLILVVYYSFLVTQTFFTRTSHYFICETMCFRFESGREEKVHTQVSRTIQSTICVLFVSLIFNYAVFSYIRFTILSPAGKCTDCLVGEKNTVRRLRLCLYLCITLLHAG